MCILFTAIFPEEMSIDPLQPTHAFYEMYLLHLTGLSLGISLLVLVPYARVAHAAWTLAAAGYLLNAVVVTFAFFGAVGASVGDWFLAVAYALAGVPLSRWGWFGSLRDASRRPRAR